MNTTEDAPESTLSWQTPEYEVVETALEVTAYALTD
ncbi:MULTISPECIES: pyrroloquinoline quinone precursor peptide PqqA [Streptomyces]|uniref:Coenzyme PQQ synthesis protein A n=2 Tax=Streptomyces TaxID=1883 RepID=A0A646KEK3_STRJU|nr:MULTISPECIES: pyrroloquinoline quinone precursor peptide PqqA [Streptomyces]MQS36301.1 pyrroloquinoline quinone precursor peptide PqqA [Streptomyces katsurahamanus]MQS99445.1 pyrroloquinoline quinone precursor peptide PqqA [Streptomyces jumonjinensis]